MEILPISKFKSNCLSVLEDVKRQKKKIIITKRGEPIAEIRPIEDKSEEIPLKETVLFLNDIYAAVAENDWKVLK